MTFLCLACHRLVLGYFDVTEIECAKCKKVMQVFPPGKIDCKACIFTGFALNMKFLDQNMTPAMIEGYKPLAVECNDRRVRDFMEKAGVGGLF